MRTLSHPLRLDNSGALVGIDQGSDRHAAELAGVVIATGKGERPLAPTYGLADPTSSGVSSAIVAAAVARCEPDLKVTAATVTGSDTAATVQLSVTWAE